MTAISQPIPAPARNHSIPTEPGYITTLSLGGSDYYVHAYIEAADGTRTYLPQNCDPQLLEKVRSLTWGMFNAHEELRKSRNETPLSVRHVDATGLVKTDNTVTSHDFAIQPVSSLVASTMADALTRDGCPQEATTIKTQDVWNRMETLIRTTIGQPSSNPISPPLPTPTTTLDPTPIDTPPPPPQPTPPSNPQPIPPQPTPQRPTRPLVSADLDTRGIDFNQSNWYEQIPPRQRLRIASDITSYRRVGYGGIFEKVCELFKQRAQNTPSNLPWITLLERERDQLKIQCHNLPSPIPHPIRRRGNAIIESSEENLQTQIQAFMAEEFEHREELYQRIREQAEAEGVTIEASDREWAQNHALENTHRFVQGLARWLDNN